MSEYQRHQCSEQCQDLPIEWRKSLGFWHVTNHRDEEIPIAFCPFCGIKLEAP